MAVLRKVDSGEVIALHLEAAHTGWQRSVGLIGRAELPVGCGLWLNPCNGIHTFGVRFPIDVLFLDRAGCVLRIVRNLPPCRICGPVRKARTVVELPAGALSSLTIAVGAHLEIISE